MIRTKFNIFIFLYLSFNSCIVAADDDSEQYVEYEVVYDIPSKESSLKGFGNINSTNAEILSYGYQQFEAINGMIYSSKTNKIQPPIWFDWLTVDAYRQKGDNQVVEYNQVVKRCDVVGKRILVDTTVPSYNIEYLKDSSGNKIHYETVISPRVVDYLNSNPTHPLSFPKGDQNNFGSMVIKLAWKELTSSDISSDYYNVEAVTLKSDGNGCRTLKVGLISMHMIYKTVKQPNWVWSTFVHRLNAPTESNINKEKYWTLYDKSSSAKINEFDRKGGNSRIIDTYVPWFDSLYGDYLTNSPESVYENYQYVLRNMEGTSSLKSQMSHWMNYIQVGTQWALDVEGEKLTTKQQKFCRYLNAGDSNLCIMPSYLSNTAIEPYEQHESCMSCHNGGKKNKTEDFLFFPKQLNKER
ncbi:hypothetical protein [Vibrio cionasavignyae]|uniref:hypothetical protein n=1 Tax=Vibrio cionasavignyae TaxID=2910252 RepID=UPI003D102452